MLLEYIGQVVFGPLRFEAYEAMGGHVQGETVFVERGKHWVFPGDILVNLKGFTREQAAFNRLAPYLMTSVNVDSAAAGVERDALIECEHDGAEEALRELLPRLDISQPMWLPRHRQDWDEYSLTRFRPEHFVESVDFDYMEVSFLFAGDE